MQTIKKIYVRSEDLGYFTQVEIPVVKREQIDENEFNIIFCNHGGAEIEEVEQQYNRIDEPDIVWTDKLLICGKCKSWKLDGDSEWHDSPIEGKHYE